MWSNYHTDKGSNMFYCYTEEGLQRAYNYIAELEAQRKEILDAGLDTADDTTLPTADDILADAEDTGFDEYGEAINGWGVTDNYNSDYPITLKLGEDVIGFDNPIYALEFEARKIEADGLEFSDGEIEINIDGDITINEYAESQGASMLRKVFGLSDIFKDTNDIRKLCDKRGWAYVG